MCTAYILNKCPTKAFQSITPYEPWHGGNPSIGHLRVFGCLAYALVPVQQRQKLDDKAVKCIFEKVKVTGCIIHNQNVS